MIESGKILIVDDEENIRSGLRAMLAKDGHEIREVDRADLALEYLKTFAAETAVVDIRLPGMNGIDLLAEIRSRWPHISVVLLTGHGTLETAMTAVKEGAHDYLLKPTKPAALREVVEEALTASRRRREEALLINNLRSGLQRLAQLPAAGPAGGEDTAVVTPIVSFGDLRIDQQAHEVTCTGHPISLTPSEYNLLLVLATRPGEVMTYVDLVRDALHYQAEVWEAKELIKRHVFTLRQKIEPDTSNPRYIFNVRGVGYRFARNR